MNTLAILLPILMAGPVPTTEAPEVELPRRSGLSVEQHAGVAIASTPGDDAWISMVGAAMRLQFAYRFLMNRRWRVGPVLGYSISLAQATDDEGVQSFSGYMGGFLAAEVEFEIDHETSLVGSVGPTLLYGRGLYLGPEVSLGLVQSFPGPERRVGLSVRGTIAPVFALDLPNQGPGYVAQLTLGFFAGAK